MAESPRSPEDFEKGYFDKMWEWYAAGGCADVVAYLRIFPIGKFGFNPKAQPVKTKAFWKIAHGHVAQEDAQIADVLDLLGKTNDDGSIKWPDAVTMQQIKEQAADLATLVSSKVMRRQLNAGDHRQLVDEALAEMSQTGNARQKTLV